MAQNKEQCTSQQSRSERNRAPGCEALEIEGSLSLSLTLSLSISFSLSLSLSLSL